LSVERKHGSKYNHFSDANDGIAFSPQGKKQEKERGQYSDIEDQE